MFQLKNGSLSNFVYCYCNTTYYNAANYYNSFIFFNLCLSLCLYTPGIGVSSFCPRLGLLVEIWMKLGAKIVLL